MNALLMLADSPFANQADVSTERDQAERDQVDETRNFFRGDFDSLFLRPYMATFEALDLSILDVLDCARKACGESHWVFETSWQAGVCWHAWLREAYRRKVTGEQPLLEFQERSRCWAKTYLRPGQARPDQRNEWLSEPWVVQAVTATAALRQAVPSEMSSDVLPIVEAYTGEADAAGSRKRAREEDSEEDDA